MAENPQNAPKTTRHGKLTPRAERFANMVALDGMTYANAYRKAYDRLKLLPTEAGNAGWKLAQTDKCAARIKELREKTQYKAILSVNERYQKLAEIIQSPKSSAMEQIRATEVYNKMSGGNAPERIEIGGTNGAPIAVESTVTVKNLSVRDRARQLIEAKKRREAADAGV